MAISLSSKYVTKSNVGLYSVLDDVILVFKCHLLSQWPNFMRCDDLTVIVVLSLPASLQQTYKNVALSIVVCWESPDK